MHHIPQIAGTRLVLAAGALLLLGATVKPNFDVAPYLHAQDRVDIGGRTLNLYCTGTGSPTVILDAGAGDTMLTWRLIQPAVSRRTRVCAYDRAGLGFSDPGPLPRDASAAVGDLHALLARGGVAPPYVLVSHSLAGLYARLYADRYLQEVTGMVLVEPGVEYQVKQIGIAAPMLAPALAQIVPSGKMCAASAARGRLKPGFKAFAQRVPPPDPALPKELNDLKIRQWQRAGTWRDNASEDEASGTSTSRQVHSAQRQYGNIPLVVVTAANPIADLDSVPLPKAQRSAVLRFALQSRVRLPTLSSSGSSRVAPHCNHEDIVTRCAAIVIDSINAVIVQARRSANTSAPPTADTSFPASKVTSAIREQLASTTALGVAVAIVHRGTVVYQRGFGVRDRDRNLPVDAATHFEIGSNTKQFTAAAILQLKEQGRLGLDDRLAAFVPDFPHAKELTLRQLLNQTSGLFDYVQTNHFVSMAQGPGGFDRIESLVKDPLHFVPGTQWEYSNTNYIALGRAIEVTSRVSYDQYVRDHLFSRAGMADTTTIDHEPTIPNMARGYWRGMHNDEPLAPAPEIAASWTWSAGNIVSTVGDIAKWDLGLQSGKIVTPADFAVMTTPPTFPDGKAGDYGFGWWIDSLRGHKRIEHDGDTFGFSASNWLFPADDLAIIVLENEPHDAAAKMARKVFDAISPP